MYTVRHTVDAMNVHLSGSNTRGQFQVLKRRGQTKVNDLMSKQCEVDHKYSTIRSTHN